MWERDPETVCDWWRSTITISRFDWALFPPLDDPRFGGEVQPLESTIVEDDARVEMFAQTEGDCQCDERNK